MSAKCHLGQKITIVIESFSCYNHCYYISSKYRLKNLNAWNVATIIRYVLSEKNLKTFSTSQCLKIKFPPFIVICA
jgi:hypothetical protein